MSGPHPACERPLQVKIGGRDFELAGGAGHGWMDHDDGFEAAETVHLNVK